MISSQLMGASMKKYRYDTKRVLVTLSSMLALCLSGCQEHKISSQNGHSAVQVRSSTHNADANFRIANGKEDEIFDGIGGLVDSAPLLYAYPEPQRSQILDYLFKPNYGQAIQVLKLEIGGDTNSTVNSEHSYQHSLTDQPNVMKSYEVWMAQEALKRNPNIKIWGLQWTAPHWVGAICSQQDNNYLARWITLMHSQAGIRVDYISAGQNEQLCPPNAPLTDQQNITSLRKTLDKNYLQHVKIIGYDGGYPPPSLAKLRAQPKGDLYAVGLHYPAGWQQPLTWGPVDNTAASVKSIGIKYWASENNDFQSFVPTPYGTLTSQYNFLYLQYGITLITEWSLIGAAYSNMEFMEHSENASPQQMSLYAEEPWSGHYHIFDAPFWSMAHTTQFTQAGWHFVKSASSRLPKGGSIVTYRSGANKDQDWTAVIETTDATETQTVHLSFDNNFNKENYSIFSSNSDSDMYFNNLGKFSKDAKGITLSIKPHSMVTVSSLTGQHKGMAAAKAPPSRAFPHTYLNNFDSYRTGETQIGYFAPIQGAFEIQKCKADRPGKCMVQVATPNPVRWPYSAANADPFVLVGDRASTDSIIRAKIKLPDTNSTSYGAIGGHAQLTRAAVEYGGYGVFKGYELRLSGNGTWELAYTDTARQVLASGPVKGSSLGWHSLQLKFSRGAVTACIDGKAVTRAFPIIGSLSSGMGALLSSFSPVQFDDFSMVKMQH